MMRTPRAPRAPGAPGSGPSSGSEPPAGAAPAASTGLPLLLLVLAGAILAASAWAHYLPQPPGDPLAGALELLPLLPAPFYRGHRWGARPGAAPPFPAGPRRVRSPARARPPGGLRP